MSTLVGSISVHQLDNGGITAHNVRNCCQIQFGNDLLFRHSALTDEVRFYTDRPERVFKRPDTVPVLRLNGSLGTCSVALVPPCQLHTYLPEPKVVPTRSKKLLLT